MPCCFGSPPFSHPRVYKEGMEVVSIHVEGATTVPMRSSVLSCCDDTGLREEIFSAAAHVALAEKMGGFEGFTVASVGRAVPAPARTSHALVATIDFAQLGGCIRQLQAEYDRVLALVEALQVPLGVVSTALATAAAAGYDVFLEAVDAAEALRDGFRSVLRQEGSSAAGGAPLPDAAAAANGTNGEASDDDGRDPDDRREGGDYARDYDPSALGYAPLLEATDAAVGDDDGDDGDDEGRPQLERSGVAEY